MDIGGRHNIGRKRSGISGAQRGGHFLCGAAEAVLGCHQGEQEAVPEQRRRRRPERRQRYSVNSSRKRQRAPQANAMNVEKSQMEEKAVHSWSRLSSAGQSAFEEALRVFNPMSKDLTDTETQLVSFLQGLREEGYQPTILSSKDVYGYNSTTADTPPPLPVGPKCPPKNTPTVSSSSKSHSKNQTGKLANPKVNISVSATRISSRHLTKNSTNLLLSSLKQSDSEKTKGSRVSFQSDLYPAMKLSVVLEALVPFKATASSLASLKEQPLVITSKQNTKGKSNKAYQALMKETSTLNGVVLNGINGKILKENDACRAFQILNGRVLINSHPHCNGMAQSKHNSGKVQTDLEAAKRQLGDRDKKRKLNEISEEAPFTKRIRITLPLVKRSPFDKDKYNFLKSSVIKIDKTSSDEEVRRKAQQILRVNLSPVLRIQPLFVSLH